MSEVKRGNEGNDHRREVRAAPLPVEAGPLALALIAAASVMVASGCQATCSRNADCGGATPVCDTSMSGGQCVVCLSSADCGGATPVCDVSVAGGRCATCLSSADCGGATPVCDVSVAGGRCVACEVRISPTTRRAQPGEVVVLSGTCSDSSGGAVSTRFSWMSSDVQVASLVTSGGATATFSANAEGGALITASAGTVSGSATIAVGDPGDLAVRFIHRLPELDFVWASADPAVEGWPAIGQVVTWQAHVANTARWPRDVPYAWYLDGTEVASGTVRLAARSTGTVEWPWAWTFARHSIELVLDPLNVVGEAEEQNNRLRVYSDAISLGLYVEQGVYDYFAQHQHRLDVRANSWDDWAQRQVRMWNQMFETARTPEAPQGVLDRIRLDMVTVVPDGALPLAGGLPSNNPNASDRTVDLQWGFPASLLSGTFYSDHTSTGTGNPFFYEGSLIHELGHARYLIDTYGFNVHDSGSGDTVAIRENGQLIVGTPYMPFIAWDAVHYTSQSGLMAGEYSFVDSYSVAALNLIAGRRAVLGNMNAPGNIGVFMNDLPAENRVTVKDLSGRALAGARVDIYQAAGKTGVWYGKVFDAVPDLTFVTDGQGQILVGRCPFDPGGVIRHTYEISNGTAIVRVEHSGQVGYGFIESVGFNLEYWRGHRLLGEHELRVGLR